MIRICDGVRTEVEDVERLEQLFDELLETHANIGMLLVLTHGTPMPDATGQRRVMESMRSYADRLVGVGVLLGIGFWASAVSRTVAAIVRMVGYGSFWHERSVEDGIARLTMELVGVDGDELMREYEQLWAQLQQLRASGVSAP